MVINKSNIEILKMVFYVFFPIGTFVIYSNPTLFEKQIIKRAPLYPPLDYEQIDMLEEIKQNIRQKQLENMKREYEKKTEK